MNIYDELDENEFYQETFMKPVYPPMPEEVLGWDIGLQELFCILSLAHHRMGMRMEEADEKALKQVKDSDWYALWIDRAKINDKHRRTGSY
jgi:hypothetical protein